MSPGDFRQLRRMASLLDHAEHNHRPGKKPMRCVACQWARLQKQLRRALFFDRQHPDHSWEVTKAIRARPQK